MGFEYEKTTKRIGELGALVKFEKNERIFNNVHVKVSELINFKSWIDRSNVIHEIHTLNNL